MSGSPDRPVHIRTTGPYSPGIVEGDYIVAVQGSPFVTLEDCVLGPAEGPRLPLDIEPSREEFMSGSVFFAPSLIETMDALLQGTREALVIGEAASGKTTLAWGYGFNHRAGGGQVLYLDCKDHVETLNAAIVRSQIESESHSRLLLLIDNVHLIGERFEQLRRALRNLQAPEGDEPQADTFSVLYIGRPVKGPAGERPRTYERMEAAGHVIYLRASREAFWSVHRRLALRNKVSAPRPDDASLDLWVREFGGDLIAFAIALEPLGAQLTDPNLTISPEVALANVRRRYLHPLANDQSAYWNLLLLCTMTELELVADGGMFATDTPIATPFGPLVETGIVYGRAVGTETKYELFHPSIGTLILRAAPKARSRAEILADGCYRRPNSIVHLLMRLYDLGCFDDAQKLEAILRTPEFLARCTASFRAQEWHKLFRTLTKSAPDAFLYVEGELQTEQHLDELVRHVIASPPQFLSAFIRYTEKKSPDLARSIRRSLFSEENQIAFLENALERPLADLSLFLNYASDEMQDLAAALGRRLSEQRMIRRLLKKITESELHFVSVFLRYADTFMPAVAGSLRDVLNGDYRVQVAERALVMEPHLLVEFLEYVDRAMPNDLGVYLRGRLTEPESMERLADRLPSVGLGHVRLFFQYAKRAMPALASGVAKSLSANQRERLLRRALETPVSELGAFLSYASASLPDIGTMLDEGLASSASDQLVEQVLIERHLHLVASFLRQAQTAAQLTFKALMSRLGCAQYRDHLLARAADTPLGSLKSTFTDLDEIAPELSETLKAGLLEETYIVRLEHRALETPLDHLASFLRYADGAMPSVSASIKQWLLREANQEKLISRALRTPSQNMRGFLNYADSAAPELVAAIRSGRVQKSRGIM